MASHSNIASSIEKLKGRENYETWKFSVQAYLQVLDLWHQVNDPVTEFTETDPVKKDELMRKNKRENEKAKSTIILLVDPINFVHIQSAVTAKEVWDNLQKAFQDSGLMRRVGLLRELVSTKLSDCESMEEFVNKIIGNAHKLNGAGMKIDDVWIGTLLLAGLNDDFKPMIMAIESSGIEITSDFVKTKLLQEVRPGGTGDNSNAAMFTKKSKSRPRKTKKPNDGKCFNCGGDGHYSNKCPSKPKENSENHATVFSCFATSNLKPNDWYIDSGASNHMTCQLDWMGITKPAPSGDVKIANDSQLKVESQGDVHVKLELDRRDVNVTFKDVLYVPNLCTNLLSVSQMVTKGLKVQFSEKDCNVFDKNGQLVVKAILTGGIFRVMQSSNSAVLTVTGQTKENQALWHRRLGHLGYDNLIKLKNGFVEGLDFVTEERVACETCIMGKQTRRPFSSSSSQSSSVLELVHSDLCGPMAVETFSGSRYIMTFLDDFSRKIFVYFIRNKSQAVATFVKFKAMAETQTGKRMKNLRTDNGTEYVNNEFRKILCDSGVQHQTTAPYTPEQNGKAERMNRTLVEKARCMLIDAKLNAKFWGEAINTASYLINRSPRRGGIDKTPEEIWTGKRPNVSNLKVFGCKAMVHVAKQHRKKFDPKSKPYVMVGYGENCKAFRVFDPDKMEVKLSRDVIFMENQFCEQVSDQNSFSNHFYIFEEINNEVEDVQVDHSNDNLINEEPDDNENVVDETISDDNGSYLTVDENVNEYVPSDEDDQFTDTVMQDVRRSQRVPKPIVRDDFVSYASVSNGSGDPLTVEEALSGPNANEWKTAMEDEYRSLIENGTWSLEQLPENRKAIQCKWVFKTKIDNNGAINRYKARLVVKGCAQRYGIDYEETFSPVVRYTSIRFLIALAAKYNLDIDQMDAVTAFLHGELDEQIYMAQPQMYNDNSNRVCLLKKSLYGLKQASRVWNQRLGNALKTFGLKSSDLDSCIYYNVDGQKMMFVAVYVDDLLVFTNDRAKKMKLKSFLMSQFKMKDIGQAKYVLGIRITRDRKSKSISIDQSQYIQTILERFQMKDCNPVSTPSDLGKMLTSDMSPKNETERMAMKNVPYQEAIGSILFAAQVSRPDIQYAVGAVSRYNNDPGAAHWLAVKRILRYLKGTIDFHLTYDGNASSTLEGYCDADWASDTKDRRSTTGYVFMLQGGAITWNSKKQPTVALSTTEAEYMAMSMATQEAMWLKSLYEEVLDKNHGTVNISSDNKGAISLGEKTVFSSRTKHIDIRHHFLREKVNDKLVKFSYVETNKMVADSLTKPVNSEKHSFCSKGFNLI